MSLWRGFFIFMNEVRKILVLLIIIGIIGFKFFFICRLEIRLSYIISKFVVRFYRVIKIVNIFIFWFIYGKSIWMFGF